MAMQDPILFTGKELNFEIPKSTELNAAADRLREKVLREEDMQEKLQKEFRDNMNLDLETFTSNFAIKQQAEMAKAFTDKYTLRAKQNGGKLTNDDLIEMRADQNALGVKQKEWLSSQAQWANDYKMVQQKPEDFDQAKFAADTKNFLETGIYQPNSLEFSGIDMGSFFANEKWRGSKTKDTQVLTKDARGNDVYTTTVQNVADEDEARTHVLETILGDATGRALKGVIAKFMNESDTKKMEYLSAYDKNKDNKISEEELGNVNLTSMNILDNPILKYAQDTYAPIVMRESVATETKPAPRLTGGAKAKTIEPFTEEWGQSILWGDKIQNVPFINDFLYGKKQHKVIAEGSQIYSDEAPGTRINIGSAREAKWIADYMNSSKNFKTPKGEGIALDDNGVADLSMESAAIPLDKQALPGVVPPKGRNKIEAMQVLSYDNNAKKINLSVTNNRGTQTVAVSLKDINNWPEEVRGDLNKYKISMPDGSSKTLLEIAGGTMLANATTTKPKGELDEL